MKILGLIAFVFALPVLADKPLNVEYIDIEPADYGKIDLIPGYGAVSEDGTQYIKLVVVRNDDFGVMSTVRLFLYANDNRLKLITQNYHHCSEEHNKCFIEFNVSPSELGNMVVELYYMKPEPMPMFREYRVKGLGMPGNLPGSTR